MFSINSRLDLESGSRTGVVRVSKLLLYFANIRKKTSTSITEFSYGTRVQDAIRMFYSTK